MNAAKDAGSQPEDEIEMRFVCTPKRCGRQEDRQLAQSNHQEIHQKSHPDDKTRLAESPHLGYAVVEDVGNGETEDACRHGKLAELQYFCFKKVAGNQASAEEYAHNHIGDTHRFVLYHILFCFK